jgi:hypothetical protein
MREQEALSSHPCVVVALANQTRARDRRPDELSSLAMPNGGAPHVLCCASLLLFVQLSCSDASELMPVKVEAAVQTSEPNQGREMRLRDWQSLYPCHGLGIESIHESL